MERADWLAGGFDSAQARFLMLTAITHHRFSSRVWGEREIRRLYAELTEIDVSAARVLDPGAVPVPGSSCSATVAGGAGNLLIIAGRPAADWPLAWVIRGGAVGAGKSEQMSGGGIPASCNAAAAHACQPGRMPLRCLIVDDSDTFLRAASILLEGEGVTVAGVASNSAEALRQARALRPDVILVDVGLGEESGFDLAGQLAQDGQDGKTQGRQGRQGRQSRDDHDLGARRSRLCGPDR